MLLSYYRRPLFILLLAYAGCIVLFRAHFLKADGELPFALPRSGALVEGRVAEYPAYSRKRWRFELKDVSLYNSPAKVSLMVYARDLRGASYGDRVSMLADLGTPAEASSPGGLDWAAFLARRGISAEARALDLEVVKPAGPVIRLARAFRGRVLGAFEKNLSPESASVLSGVVIGEKKNVTPDIRTAFQDSGAMHLLVASGSNVGFVVVVVYALCARLRLRRKVSGCLALAASGFYVLASGLDAPLVRAYLMFAAGLAAFVFRRESGAFHSLTLAALAILLVSPRALFDAGFQMSFLAAYGLTVGISVWNGQLKSLLRGLLKPWKKSRGAALTENAAEKLSGLLMVSFFAQLGLYPLLALYFHKISAVSLLSNMVLVPASGIAMALGFIMAFVPAWAGVHGIYRLSALFMDLFISAVKFFAALPFASFQLPEPSPWMMAGFYVAAFALLHAPLLGFRKIRLYACMASGLGIMSAGPAVSTMSGSVPAGHALLFGDSDTTAVLLRLPDGSLFLVNPGAGGKKLADAVLAEGRTGLDGLLLTSLEEKNYTGLAGLAKAMKIKELRLPYGPRQPALEAALAAAAKNGASVERVWPGGTGPVQAVWPAGAGYNGHGDVYDWMVHGVKVTEAGRCASDCTRGACRPPVCYDPAARKMSELELKGVK